MDSCHLRDAAESLDLLGMSHQSLQVDATPQSSQASVESRYDSQISMPDNHSSDAEQEVPVPKRIKVSASMSVRIENSPADVTQGESQEAENDSSTIENEMGTSAEMEVYFREFKSCHICPECSERVDNRNLARHMKEHHLNKRFYCDQCGITYQRKGYLLNHKCKKDLTVNPFHCEHCDKRFASEEKLASHNKNKSKVCPRFKCSQCDDKFCTKGWIRGCF